MAGLSPGELGRKAVRGPPRRCQPEAGREGNRSAPSKADAASRRKRRYPNPLNYVSLIDVPRGVGLRCAAPIMAWIAPALLAADFARLAEALEIFKSAGASMVHVDVMDGHFAPDITVGQPVIASLRKATDLILDVHLLVERPERYVADFVDAGAERLSVHAEATPHLHRVLDLIRERGAKAGAALKPATPVEALADVLGDSDFVTVLAADPGIKEQAFIPGSCAKVRALSDARRDRRLQFALQVEGAISFDNLAELVRAGADILVAGPAIFHSDNPRVRLSEMIRLASETRQTSKV